MEAIEELEFMDNNDATTVTHIAKGKRTKRQRPFSPCAVVAAAGITTSSSSSTTVSGDHAAATDYGSISSATTTNYESTEEEEDMANCLILLAQGGDHHTARNNTTAIAIAKQRQSDSDIQSLAQSERGGSRRFAEMAAATTAAARIGFYVYECKTCNRTFPSFQALGGHRASHKKPKLVVVEEKKPPPPPPVPPVSSQIIHNFEIEEAQLKSGAQISLQLGSNNNKAAKIHECSICGSEFTSGQALGGHMRRHRASTSTSSTTTTNSTPPPLNQNGAAVEMKPRNILALDLNLPAPEEDLRDSKFQFTPKQKALVMSAPSLVGCHY